MADSLHYFLIAVACVLLVNSLAVAEEPGAGVHWAFRPVERPPLPIVKNANLVESPVDAFILEKLEAAGLQPAIEADKRTLIRRATYDLLGLPPTADEVADFLADQSPQAFARVVDRLLASPHYGERWGRHWLDIARYGNTLGDTVGAESINHYAFTYRDYVIKAFNEDLPYDQFLMEQIAADQLPHEENATSLAALGFITVGRRFLNNIHDTIDDRIDVITRGTMSLTVSCARCHDHKYDPIPTQDYYSLYGVLASSMEPDQLPVIGQTDPAALAEYRGQREKIEAKRTEFIKQQDAEVVEQFRKLTAESLLASLTAKETPPAATAGVSFPDNDLRRSAAHVWKEALEKLNRESDPIFSPWFAFTAIPEAEFATAAKDLAAKIAANGLAHPVNPLIAQAFAGDPPASLKDVAERYARAFGEASKSLPPPAENAPAVPADPAREALRQFYLADGAPGNPSEKTIRKVFSPMIHMQIQQFKAELTQLDQQHAGAPLRAPVVIDKPMPQNARVFVRGNPNNPGDEVPRQFLEVLAGATRKPFQQGSGRLDLARAIVSRENPLTARVIVNRVWMHHFGEGFVSTADDFGLRSEPPTHPQLLDFLATWLVDEGWSLKKLHRLIMLSHVYRQSSDNGLRSDAADPQNLLLSRMNRRRLDFESLRDTLLAVSGSLDRSMGGRPVELIPQPRVAPAGAFISEANGQPSLRRAIYAFIDRQNLPGVMRTFDFADPDTTTARRYVTTVPQQALFFFNNPFVMQQAHNLIKTQAFQQLDTAEKRIHYLYQRIFQRDAVPAELELATRFIATEEAAAPSTDPNPLAGLLRRGRRRSEPLGPWDRFAHVLLMSDELMFVD